MKYHDSIIAATISNSAGLLIGHPLDTIKVCLQLILKIYANIYIMNILFIIKDKDAAW